MSYQLYRNTTLGNTLQESLDELIQVCICKRFFIFEVTYNKVFCYIVDSVFVYFRLILFMYIFIMKI